MDQATVIVTRLALGLVLSMLIGWLAYRRRSLSRSGIAGAVITGTMIFGLGGLLAGLLLIAFFVSSSVLSHYRAGRKRDVAEKFDKSSQRDLGQALANGGVAAIAAALSGVWLWSAPQPPEPSSAPWILLGALVGALATVNADTWATEIGVLSKHPPRMVTDLSRVVEPGTSGGITLVGTLAAVAGAAFIGAMTLLLCVALWDVAGLVLGHNPAHTSAPAWGQDPGVWLANTPVAVVAAGFPLAGLGTIALAAPSAGLIGSLADSLLGATVQGIYYDPSRQKETEKPVDRDGMPNPLARGWRWLNNDWVNFISSLAGAAVAGLIVTLTQ
ncbi:MAG: DUF92 domain-containing protein [Candidatus Roseilinea sp.]|uniref:DUF92 domain-containing protein n=1 Tax=Candidatus Roseilinea sp. TaxID=2838777 RepID=UPI00404A1058